MNTVLYEKRGILISWIANQILKIPGRAIINQKNRLNSCQFYQKIKDYNF